MRLFKRALAVICLSAALLLGGPQQFASAGTVDVVDGYRTGDYSCFRINLGTYSKPVICIPMV